MRSRFFLPSVSLLMVSGIATNSIVLAQVSGDSDSVAKRSIFEGDWENSFLSSRLVFRFQPENGVLAGWFVSTKNGQSYPLKSIRVKGRNLSFIYEATPEITYTLTAQKGDQVLSGVWSMSNGASVPTMLVRKQSQ